MEGTSSKFVLVLVCLFLSYAWAGDTKSIPPEARDVMLGNRQGINTLEKYVEADAYLCTCLVVKPKEAHKTQYAFDDSTRKTVIGLRPGEIVDLEAEPVTWYVGELPSLEEAERECQASNQRFLSKGTTPKSREGRMQPLINYRGTLEGVDFPIFGCRPIPLHRKD